MCSSFANFVLYAFVVKSLVYEKQKSKQNPQILNAPLPNSGVWEMGIVTLWPNLPGDSDTHISLVDTDKEYLEPLSHP